MKRFLQKLPILILLQILFTQNNYATGELTPVGARQAGMGRTSVAMIDFWGVMNNQAGIALFDRISAGISYENRFMLNKLSSKSLGLVVPTKMGVLGLSYQHNGFNLYNEQKAGLVYARSFAKYLRIGLQLDYLQTTLGDNYGKKGNVTFELGVQSDVSEQLTIGVWSFNPIRVKLADYDSEKIQAIYRFGMRWKSSSKFSVTFEAEKNTFIKPVVLRGGFEYAIKDQFFIRAGTSSRAEIFTLGFGFKSRLFIFDIGAIMHESLGFSTQASLLFHF
jgi:hypothetical protein